jgi:hypothetical protein
VITVRGDATDGRDDDAAARVAKISALGGERCACVDARAALGDVTGRRTLAARARRASRSSDHVDGRQGHVDKLQAHVDERGSRDV